MSNCIVTPPGMPRVMVVPVAGPSGPQGPPGGTAITMTAAVNLSGHRMVTRNSTGTAVYADATNLAHLNAPSWLTLGAASSGGTVSAQSTGIVDEPSWTWTVGPLYLGLSGLLTQVVPVAPTAVFLVQVGYATAATSIVLDRQPSIRLI